LIDALDKLARTYFYALCHERLVQTQMGRIAPLAVLHFVRCWLLLFIIIFYIAK
jgi:hypothetical protein